MQFKPRSCLGFAFMFVLLLPTCIWESMNFLRILQTQHFPHSLVILYPYEFVIPLIIISALPLYCIIYLHIDFVRFVRLILYPLLIGLSDLRRISLLTCRLWRAIVTRFRSLFRPVHRPHTASDPTPVPGDSSQRRSLSRTPSRPRSSTSPEAPEPTGSQYQQFDSLQTQTLSADTRARESHRSVPTPTPTQSFLTRYLYAIPQQFRWYLSPAVTGISSTQFAPPHALGEHQCERCCQSARAVRSEVDELAAAFNSRLMCVLFAASWSTFYGAILPILFANVRFMFYRYKTTDFASYGLFLYCTHLCTLGTSICALELVGSSFMIN